MYIAPVTILAYIFWFLNLCHISCLNVSKMYINGWSYCISSTTRATEKDLKSNSTFLLIACYVLQEL
jgi:hypothetical protein